VVDASRDPTRAADHPVRRRKERERQWRHGGRRDARPPRLRHPDDGQPTPLVPINQWIQRVNPGQSGGGDPGGLGRRFPSRHDLAAPVPGAPACRRGRRDHRELRPAARRPARAARLPRGSRHVRRRLSRAGRRWARRRVLRDGSDGTAVERLRRGVVAGRGTGTRRHGILGRRDRHLMGVRGWRGAPWSLSVPAAGRLSAVGSKEPARIDRPA
jgi:hypothetical protein